MDPSWTPFLFDRCAVVGSGANLAGRGLGTEIDAHDVVVHVNNIPTLANAADQGSRTDVLFSTLCNFVDNECTGSTDWSWCEVHQEIQGGGEVTCPVYTTYNRCPFHAAFYRNQVLDSCSERLSILERAASSTATIGLAMSSEFVSRTAHHMRRRSGNYCCDPSTGFHAVLTIGMLCNTVDLYGFHGTASVDGHPIGHDIMTEHALLRQVVNRSLPDEDYPSAEIAERWRETRMRYADI